jgi:hypothetical protein
MVDVGGEDRTAPGDLVADELRRVALGDLGSEALSRMAMGDLRQGLPALVEELVLADRHELHLGGDLAAARVVHLGHPPSGARPERLAAGRESDRVEGSVRGAPATVERADLGELLDVAPALDPRTSRGGQTAVDVDLGLKIGVGARGVVDHQRWVFDQPLPLRAGLVSDSERSGSALAGRRLLDLAHRDADRRVRSGDMDLARAGQRPEGEDVGADGFRDGHRSLLRVGSQTTRATGSQAVVAASPSEV